MKDFFKGIAMVTAALILFPAVPYIVGTVFPPDEPAVEASADIQIPREDGYDLITEVYIYDTVSERVLTVSTEEYVAAALAAQLSPDAEPELLKAQAVLMYTYILRRRMEENARPSAELYGCDISTDTNKYPRLALGNEPSFALELFRKIAREVMGEYCSYGGEPISVAYCSSAGASTESSDTVLGVDVPYLKSTPTFEPDGYYTTVSYTEDEVSARLMTADDGYILLGEPDGWITLKDVTESGYVQSVYISSQYVVSGIEIARLLNLPSARFTFRYSSGTNKFIFTVSGSGSLVGLSQRGGNALAAEGYNYREILLHFFSGIDIKTSRVLAE